MHSLAGGVWSRNRVVVLRWWYSALSHSRHSTMEAWWAVGFQQQVMGSSWGSLALIVDIPVETATTTRNISVLTLGRNRTHALSALTEPLPVVASNRTWTDTWTDITGLLANWWQMEYWLFAQTRNCSITSQHLLIWCSLKTLAMSDKNKQLIQFNHWTVKLNPRRYNDWYHH